MNHRDALEVIVDGIRPMLQNMPGYHFVKDLDSCYVEISHDAANLVKMKREAIINRSDYEMPWERVARQFQINDATAIVENISDVFEPLPLELKTFFVTRCIKFPIHDQHKNVVGIVGQTYVFSETKTMTAALNALRVYDNHPVSELTKKSEAYTVGEYPLHYQFTTRETECLFLMIRGKTAKQIGKFLAISHRTVESYIEKIKQKMNVFSRSEIIEHAEKLGLLSIIPKGSILMSFQKNARQWNDCFSLNTK